MIPSALAGHFPDLPYPDLPPLASRPRLVSHMDDVEDVRTAIFEALPGSLRDVTASVFGGVSQAALTRIGNSLRTMARHGWVRVDGHAAQARWVAAVDELPKTDGKEKETILDRIVKALTGRGPMGVKEIAALVGVSSRQVVSDKLSQGKAIRRVVLVDGRKWTLP